MDDTNHLKIKIGPHEFEATGSAESVREQFQAFKEMMGTLATAKPMETPEQKKIRENNEQVERAYEAGASSPETVDNGLPQITRVDGRTVSLTARPVDISNAILMILYSQKTLRQNDGVTGAEIISGLRSTGGYSFERIDRTLEKMARDGEIFAFGEHRGKRYRLTNTGIVKARTLAASLIMSVGGSV